MQTIDFPLFVRDHDHQIYQNLFHAYVKRLGTYILIRILLPFIKRSLFAFQSLKFQLIISHEFCVNYYNDSCGYKIYQKSISAQVGQKTCKNRDLSGFWEAAFPSITSSVWNRIIASSVYEQIICNDSSTRESIHLSGISWTLLFGLNGQNHYLKQFTQLYWMMLIAIFF